MLTKLSRRRSTSLLLVLLLLSFIIPVIGSPIPTQAARATATVKNRILNVRSSASTNSSIVCKLTQGTKVTIISETTGDDGLKWYDVFYAYNGEAKDGFVRADLVNVSGNVSGSSSSSSGSSTGTNSTSGSGETKYVKPAVAIVRSYASTNGDIRSRLEQGTSVKVLSSKTGTDDNKTWYKVSYTLNGASMEGYIRGDLLLDSNPGGSASSTNTTSVSGIRYINGDVVRVRSYASTDADIRSRLTQGTKVTLLSSKTGTDGKTWYKISYTDGGYQLSGYVRSDMLSETSGGSSSAGSTSGSSIHKSAVITPLVANIRSYASTNGDIRSKLSQGTTVTITEEKTGEDGLKWYKITYTYNGASMSGYIRSDLVTISGSGSSSSGNSSSNNSFGSSASTSNSGSAVAQVRTYASPYADIRTTLQHGTKVTILKQKTGEDGQQWTKISFTQNGQEMEGYIPSSLLK